MIKIMIREVIKIEIDQIVEIGEYHSVVEYSVDRIIEIDLGKIRITETTLEEVISEEICDLQIRFIEDKIIEVDTEEIIEMIIKIEVGIDLETDNTSRNDRSSSRSRSGLRASRNRHRIRCYKHIEYDHFAKDCLMSKIEKEEEQIQQMYNMDEKQTALKTLAKDTYDSLN